MNDQVNFNKYDTFNIEFNKEQRSVNLLISKDIKNFSNESFIYELESFLIWAFQHVEINSIVFKPGKTNQNCLKTPYNFKTTSVQDVKKYSEKLQVLIYFMIQMPQTIVFDLSKHIDLFFAELSIGADLRIAHKETKLNFNHLTKGLVPSSGGISFLQNLLGTPIAKQWVLSGKEVDSEGLVKSGYVSEIYIDDNKESITENILKNIKNQSQFERIQSKLCFYEGIKDNLEKAIKIDSKVSRAALISENWKRDKEFKTPLQMAEIINSTMSPEDREKIFDKDKAQYAN
jgi:hypothetical protein